MKKEDFNNHFRKEVFRKYENTEYMVSNFGRLMYHGKIIDGEYDEHGKCISFHHKYIYQMVAKTFPEICGEWFKGCHIHHINHNRMDSCANNLIVLSAEEHRRYHSNSDITSDKHKLGFQIKEYDADWNEVCTYKSIKECCSTNNINYQELKFFLTHQLLELPEFKTEDEEGYIIKHKPIAMYDETLLNHLNTYDNIKECIDDLQYGYSTIQFYLEHHFMSENDISKFDKYYDEECNDDD